ncbi:SDR family oxidoreductase [Chloroflexus aggregans]|uniref:Short-chain dehydrogenase/reductase SDR n=1 Tax=Chloroflexus aggregans (strain MD-66 / DSM 9485) TaxID=326427 RepID=B8G5A8_CHLAD|nr:SDR family oxidoreductase [Chloroflexus aggregans]ACL25614.1 short-chain dehydrogenase/reductase SDR [Chloroflexus aggregans DSM 9485]
MELPFIGKVALVTGAASGIGRASALAFAREGAKVVVADVNVAGGEETVALCRAANTDAIFVRCDVSQSNEVEQLIAQAVDTFGRIDFAHNNAGIEGVQATLVDYPEEVWDRVIDINLKGVWLCMKYEIRQMLQQGGGAIVNTSSVAGLSGSRGVLAYVASKHGIVGITKAAALEYARSGIRVNAICPGTIHTAMIDRFTQGDPEVLAQFAESEPIGRLGSPEEVANSVVWLCSEKASFITGATLPVDGGRLA